MSVTTPQVDDLIAYGFGAGLNNIPTGFTLYNPAGGIAFAPSTAPGAVRSGQVNVPTSGLNWAVGVPVFTVGTSALECGNGLVTVANGTRPSPCQLHAKSVGSARSPMYTWTVGVQHAFTNNTSLMLNYVGTHAYNLSTMVNVNEPTPGASRALSGAVPGSVTGSYQFREPYYSQFPWFSGIFEYEPAGFSNYHALQVSFTQRNFHGITMKAIYSLARDWATTKGGIARSFRMEEMSAHIMGPILPLTTSVNPQSGSPVNFADGVNDLAGIGGSRSLLGGVG